MRVNTLNAYKLLYTQCSFLRNAFNARTFFAEVETKRKEEV